MVDSYTRLQFENLQRMYRKALSDLAAETAAREAALTSTNGDLSTLSGTVSTLSGTVAGLPTLIDAAGVKTVTATHAHVANSNPAAGENTTRVEVTIDCGTNRDSICVLNLDDLTDPSDTYGPTVKLIPLMPTVGQKLQIYVNGHSAKTSAHQLSDQLKFVNSALGIPSFVLPAAPMAMSCTRIKDGVAGILTSWSVGPGVEYRYFRLHVTAAPEGYVATSTYTTIQEIEYMQYATVLNSQAAVSAVDPYTLTAGAGANPLRAFDKINSNFWETNPQTQGDYTKRWIQIDLLTPTLPTAVRIKRRAGYPDRLPGAFVVLASNDPTFATYDTLKTVTGQTDASYIDGVWTTFNIP